jgi:hypothetical protein
VTYGGQNLSIKFTKIEYNFFQCQDMKVKNEWNRCEHNRNERKEKEKMALNR